VTFFEHISLAGFQPVFIYLVGKVWGGDWTALKDYQHLEKR